MSRRRPALFALVVLALLAVVAFAARGRPLSSGGGSGAGVPLAFWDYVFTTLLLGVAFAMLVGLAALFLFRRDPEKRQSFHRRTFRALAILIGVALLVVLIGRHVDLYHLLHPKHTPSTAAQTTGQGHSQPAPPVPPSRHPRFRWEELVIFLGLLVALGAAAYATRRRLPPAAAPGLSPEMLAVALDESLDDLRADPDLRRAIIAAYARMEATLAAAGVARHPAEAPLEYLERALLALDTSAAAVRRLTDLFEWARFSQYEPDPSMRDEAVDALVAVRDELRASAPVAT